MPHYVVASGGIGAEAFRVDTQGNRVMGSAAVTFGQQRIETGLSSRHPAGTTVDAVALDRGKGRRITLRNVLSGPEDKRGSPGSPPRHLPTCGNERLLPTMDNVPRFAEDCSQFAAIHEQMSTPAEEGRHGLQFR